MKRIFGSKVKKVLSFLLTIGLLLSVLPVSTPQVTKAAGETELILNGNFSEETEPGSGVPSIWHGDGCALTIGDDSGNPYLVIGSRGNGYSSAQQTVEGTFKKGDEIKYSYRLKAPADPRRHSRFVIKYQGDYIGIPEEPLFSQTPATGTWTVVSGSHILTRDASSLMFQIDDGSNAEGTASGYHTECSDIHIDDVSVRLQGELVNVPVTGVTVNPTTLTLPTGQTSTLSATVQPEAAAQSVTWTSSNESIATVDQYSGEVTAVAAGTATITATSTADLTKMATCTVTVPTIAVTGVTLSQNTLSLAAGAKKSLTASIQPSNASNKNLTWTTSNESVATVKTGEVTAVSAGTATITVTSVADTTKTAQCIVTVTETSTAVTGVTLDTSTLSLAAGEKKTLTPTVSPENATNKSLTWSTSNASVATVNNGEVTAVAAGEAIITVTSVADSTKKAQCTVKVTSPVPASPVPEEVLKKGDSFKLSGLTYKVLTVDAVKKSGTVQVAVASGNKNLKAVNIPNTVSNTGITFTVESIAANAFKNNKKVTTVKIGKNVKVINNGAFSGCNKLKKVTTGAALTKIGKNVFLNNKKLKTIDLRSSTKLTSVGSNAFKGILKNATVSVPKGKAAAYKKILNKGKLAKTVKVK